MDKKLEPKRKTEFSEIIAIIEQSRENAFKAVNHELISMYWNVGAYISEKVKNASWGKSVVTEFAYFIQSERPTSKAFLPQIYGVCASSMKPTMII